MSSIFLLDKNLKEGEIMSKIEMTEDKVICTVKGNEQESTVTTAASVITIIASKVILSGKEL